MPIFSDGNKTISNNQVPMVAKVLTNAAGQVISVESLLAHQKAHGTLPQGLFPRISLLNLQFNNGQVQPSGYKVLKLDSKTSST